MADDDDTQPQTAAPGRSMGIEAFYHALEEAQTECDQLGVAIQRRDSERAGIAAHDGVSSWLAASAALQRLLRTAGGRHDVALAKLALGAAHRQLVYLFKHAATQIDAQALHRLLVQLKVSLRLAASAGDVTEACTFDDGSDGLDEHPGRQVHVGPPPHGVREIAAWNAFYRQLGVVSVRGAELETAFEGDATPSVVHGTMDVFNVEWRILAARRELLQAVTNDDAEREPVTPQAMMLARAAAGRVIAQGAAFVSRHGAAASSLLVQLRQLMAWFHDKTPPVVTGTEAPHSGPPLPAEVSVVAALGRRCRSVRALRRRIARRGAYE